jgi:hypothetical protein
MIREFLFKIIYKHYFLWRFFSRFKWYRFRSMLETKNRLFKVKPGMERIYLQRNGKIIDILEFPESWTDDNIKVKAYHHPMIQRSVKKVILIRGRLINIIV